MSKRLTCFAAAGTIAALAIMAATPSTDLADAPNASHRFSLTLGTGSPVAFPFAQADFGSVDAPGLPTRSTLWAGSPAELPDVIVALGDEPISHALDRLGAAARGGDTRAALDAFRIADFCSQRASAGKLAPSGRREAADAACYFVTVKVVLALSPDFCPVAVIVTMPDAGAGPISGCGAPTKLPLASVI